MSEFKIEKGVPVPRPGNRKYPWKEMKVGDSIFFEDDVTKVQIAARQWARTNKKKFTSRKEGDGVRVWRIE